MYLIPLTLCLFVYGTKHDKSVETITTSWSLYEFSLCTKRVLESIVYLPAEATFTTNCCVLNQSRFISRYKQLLRSSFDTCYFVYYCVRNAWQLFPSTYAIPGAFIHR